MNEQTQNNQLPESPEELVKRINGYFEVSKRAKERRHKQWLNYYRHWRGLERVQTKGGRSRELINIIFATVEQKVALLSDSRPGFVFYPQDGEQDPHTADAVQSIVSDYIRDVTEMEAQEELIKMDAAIYGSGFAMYYWNGKEGETGFERMDPFKVFPAPGAKDVDDGKYFIIADAVPLYEIRRRWPGADVKADNQLLESIAYNRAEGTDAKSTVGSGVSNTVKDVSDMALVLYTWTYDDNVDQYPDGRLTITAGKTLLWDGPNPLPIKDRPFVKFDYTPDEGFWGIGEVEFLIDPSKMINKRKNQIQDNTDMLANGRMGVDVNKIPEWKKIKSKAREVIPVQGDPKSAIWVDYGRPMPQQVVADMQDSLFWVNLLSGLQDVGRGVIPKGDPSGVAIQTVMESVNIRVRKTARAWERFLKRSAQMAVDMLQLYEPTKLFAILGDGEEVKYIQADDLQLDTKYNIRVRAGSTLPSTNRYAKLEMAIRLVQAGIIPPDIALDLVDIPEVKLSIKKREQEAAAQAQAEAQAAAANQQQSEDQLAQNLAGIEQQFNQGEITYEQ